MSTQSVTLFWPPQSRSRPRDSDKIRPVIRGVADIEIKIQKNAAEGVEFGLDSLRSQPRSSAPEGDVILVLGQPEFRLRVDSILLKRHSPVFRAMLGPNFSEGQGLSSSSPKDIALPDDDPDAMRAICAIMYHAFDHIPRKPTMQSIYDMARLADKYACHDVLTLASVAYGWLKCEDSTGSRDMVNLLAVAYMIRDNGAFTEISNKLVLNCRLEELRARVQFLMDGMDLRQIAMVPESYWGVNLTS
ncbi:hypothetical protein DV735_g5852, partial [Chaetothyriales sp. CBS 134920]